VVDHPVCSDTCTYIPTERALGEVVVGCIKEYGDLIKGACAVTGIVLPDDGVDRIIDEVAFDRETELREDIVAGLEIVPDPRVENGFAVDRLIAKTGAPRLK
jgi:hypothetical protein